MKYKRISIGDWRNCVDDALVTFRPHHEVCLGDSVLLVAKDAPGWAIVPFKEFRSVKALQGKTIGEIRSLSLLSSTSDLARLARRGLIAIDGQTGLVGEPDHETTRDVMKRQQLVQITTHDSKATPPNTLLIKLTGACNWACAYCYDYDSARFPRSLRLENLRTLIDEILQTHSKARFIFHGGEPLLCFEELRLICEYIGQRAARFSNSVFFSIQTNGALLDKEKIDFLLEHHFAVGLSIDGPPEVNDLSRVDFRGRGTSHVITQLFEEHSDFMRYHVGYLTTVTSNNVGHLEETAEYLLSLGARSWKTIVFDREGRGKERQDLQVSPERYLSFLRWTLSQCATPKWSDFKFESILELLSMVFTSNRTGICSRFPCGAGQDFGVASADGKLLACDAAYDKEFELGNLADGWMTSSTTARVESLAQRESWLLTEAECSTCAWLHFCAGTCMAKAMLQHGTILAVDDFECYIRKKLFPELFTILSKFGNSLFGYYQHHQSKGAPSREN